MKTHLAAFLLLGGAWGLQAADMTSVRQVYPLAPDTVRQNALKVDADTANAPAAWKNAAAAYYVVAPMSSVQRLPDAYPADGKPFADLSIIAAKDEFEPASFVVYARKNVDKFELRISDLKASNGATLPASLFDPTVIKVWYQAGSAWYGYFADALTHVLVPELLLHDENLVFVDPATKDNYLRYNNADDSVRYGWISSHFSSMDYREGAGMANIYLVGDADTLQPVVLNKNEFKQFMVTARIPKDAKDGLYTGRIDLVADGAAVGSIPLKVRVLPFELPVPKTYYDQDKEFILCFYGTATMQPKILRNLAEHNSRYPMGALDVDTFFPEQFAKDVETANACGISTQMLFAGVPNCSMIVSTNSPAKTLKEFDALKKRLAAAAELCKKVLGHTRFYSYGIDEGGPSAIRGQRASWDAVRDLNGNTMVSTRPHGRLLYALDYAAFACAPTHEFKPDVEKYHDANPAALAGWYANPHSAPENPDYVRRYHGFIPYRNKFDAGSNYCWWRGNWNDFSSMDEHGLRGLIQVYATRDDVIDTLEWEGIREGLDDIRYATLLKQLADTATKSDRGSVKLLGRQALGWLAYLDHERDSIDAIRMECINYILRLQEAQKEGRK